MRARMAIALTILIVVGAVRPGAAGAPSIFPPPRSIFPAPQSIFPAPPAAPAPAVVPTPPGSVFVPPPLYYLAPCARSGYWSYTWVEQPYAVHEWIPGHFSDEGEWIDGWYEDRPAGGYWQPAWVGLAADC